jgi:energy-coupling factor transporter ATP-binding protein EcfA2
MLKSVRLKNFKLHEDTSIEAAPITVFIGPNNSGKSSIFQAVLCLRQAAATHSSQLIQASTSVRSDANRSARSPENVFVDVGEFKDVLRHGKNELSIGLTGTIHPPSGVKCSVPIDVDFDASVRDNTLARHRGHLRSSLFELGWEWIAPDWSRRPTLEHEGVNISISPDKSFGLILFGGYGPSISDRQKVAEVTDLGQYVANAPRTLFSSIHPIYPLRGFEESGYPLADQPPTNAERLTLADRTDAMASILAYDIDLTERLSKRLEELVGIGIRIKLLPGKRVTVWARPSPKKASDTLFLNEGTGANQLPFVLIPVALTPPNETILLSEPEVHLHPRMQCELTRTLLTVAKKENIQFFIETHSEHVLHVILNAIGKHEWKPSQVALYSFENINGTAKVIRLEIDEQGGVKGGLPGFFDQSLGELTEYLETLKKPTV